MLPGCSPFLIYSRFRQSRLMAAISIQQVSKAFGGVHAVEDCSFEIASGSITGVIGPNGAGKSTLFNILAGLLKPDSGTVWLDGKNVTGWSPHQLADLGILRTFQIAHEYARMSVKDNLMVAPQGQTGSRLWTNWLKWSQIQQEERELQERAESILDTLGLTPLKHELAGNLSGGQKKLLELGRVMMGTPQVVLLDEIGAGINRTLMKKLASHIERLNREQGVTFCVIEHDMDLIARLCDPVVVMAHGSVLMQDTMAAVRGNPDVIEAYLGGEVRKAVG